MKTLMLVALMAAFIGFVVSLVLFFKLLVAKRHSYVRSRSNTKYFGD